MLDVGHIKALLRNHNAFDAQEADNLARTHMFIDNCDRVTARSADGQLTAAGWLIDPLHRKLLLIRNDRLDKWLNPGGKYEPNDGTPERTMRREVRQETGVWINLARIRLFDIGVIDRAFNPRLPCTFYDLRFLAVANSTRPCMPEERDKQPRWLTLDEAKLLLPDDIQNGRMYRRTEQVFAL